MGIVNWVLFVDLVRSYSKEIFSLRISNIVMYGEKLAANQTLRKCDPDRENCEKFSTYRKDPTEPDKERIRLEYPRPDRGEWKLPNQTWDTIKDTWSVPTGMFKDQQGCNDKPLTVITTILNGYGKAAPKRRNPA